MSKLNAETLLHNNLGEYRKAKIASESLRHEQKSARERLKEIAREQSRLGNEKHQIEIRLTEIKTELQEQWELQEQFAIYPRMRILFEAAKSYIPVSEAKEFGEKVTRLLDEASDKGWIY
jgi:predicted nuclease with TOPRIM domain